MSERGRRLLLWLLAAGLALRLGLAFGAEGAEYDIDSLRIVRDALGEDVLGVYGDVNGAGFFRWPYPPGFFPLIAATGGLADLTGLPFHGCIQLPAIAADLAIAWLVQSMLGRRGADERTRLAAAAVVVLGPTFLAVSGYHGQIDSVAILGPLAALAVWERDGVNRALGAGLLIGLGGTVKTFPLVMLLAFLPWVRSRREAVTLFAVPAIVLAVSLAPFLIAHRHDTTRSLENRGFPGLGGISMLAEPELARAAITGASPGAPNAVTDFFLDRGGVIVALVTLAIGAFLLWARPPPLQGAVILWLGLYAFGLNFTLQYAVWLLPFLVLQRRLRTALLIQLLLLPAAVVFYGAPWEGGLEWTLYVAVMAGAWAAFVALLALEVRRAGQEPRSTWASAPT